MTQSFLIRLFADYFLVPIILIGVFALVFKVPKGQRLQAYSRVLMAGLTAYLLSKLIGSIYQPAGERPFELLGAAAGASFLNNPGFPSDHALFVTAITCAVWFETKQKTLTIILVILTISMSIARVLALVHTPTDIIGGIIFASIGALWYLNISKASKSKLILPKQQK
jgi:membrane-associated phospholipid phosphatase